MSITSRNPFRRAADGRFAESGRVLRWLVLGLLIAAVGFVSWLGYTAWAAKSGLDKARENAQQVKDELLQGDGAQAANYAQDAIGHAEAARAATHTFPWNTMARVPLLGSPFKTGQQMSNVVVGLAADLLKPAAEAGVGLSPGMLYKDGRVDLQLLSKQKAQLGSLSEAALRLDAEAAAIPQAAYLSPIRNARSQLQQQTSGIAQLLQNSFLAAQIAPSMLGGEGPRTYLMAFQTNAEARATGGLLGGFGILRFDNGKPTVESVSSNTGLIGTKATVDLGPEFKELYGWANAFTDFRNSNLSSHFPYAAQLWKSMWDNQSDVKVDGVIALDPVALSYILGAVGSITMPDGEVITSDNVVELTESKVYTRFAVDDPLSPVNFERKKYLEDIAGEVARKVTGKVESPRKLLDALGRSVSEGRIAVWSSDPAAQKILEQTRLGHAIPDDDAPYAEVIVNNLAGNKMDYYLTREIEYSADSCTDGPRNSTITVRLKNTSNDPSLPLYVAGTGGLVPGLPFKVPPGSMVTSVKLLATKGARLVGVTSDGKQISAVTTVERGHPSFEVQVAIPPGQSGELNFQLSEPSSPGAARVPIQPLIDKVTPVVSVPACS